MGLRTTLLERSKAKSSTSTTIPTSHSEHTHNIFHHNPQRQNSSSETSSASTPRRHSQQQEEVLDPDSYEAFLLKAERDERERIEVEEIERRIRRRTESWEREQERGKRKDNSGARAWLAQNGLTR